MEPGATVPPAAPPGVRAARRTQQARRGAVLFVVAVIAALTAAPAHGQCAQRRASAGYTARVDRALAAKRDVWGEHLIAAPGGPTFATANRYLAPLLLARTSGGRPLTDSGVYYLPLGEPSGPQGGGPVALHVADGGEILWNHVGGQRLAIGVGPDGGERYGSCLARLSTPTLAEGLPADPRDPLRRRARRPLPAGVVLHAGRRHRAADELRPAGGGRRARTRRRRPGFDFAASGGGVLAYAVPAGGARTVYIAWRPPSRPRQVDEAAYAAARAAVGAYWRRRLAEGTTFVVPEKRVLDAERALLVQNLVLSWRYSVGNPYQEFSFPESIDTAEVMGEYGFGAVANAILRTSLTPTADALSELEDGREAARLRRVLPPLRRRAVPREGDARAARATWTRSGARSTSGGGGLLGRERYSSDIGDSVYGFHSQAVVWQALHAIASVWAQTGERALAARCRSLAARLETALRRAVLQSQRWLPDGSLFVPARLLDDEARSIRSRTRSAGATGTSSRPTRSHPACFAPGSVQARGVLRYLELHGSRLLGLVRAGSFALYRGHARDGDGRGLRPQPRPLPRRQRPGRRTRPRPLRATRGRNDPEHVRRGRGRHGRHRFAARTTGRCTCPPNATSNASFLETLRLMLIHETTDKNGAPTGLELAYATPRAWLRPGHRMLVHAAPTSFGPVTFSIVAAADSARVRLSVPNRPAPPSLRLRLRAPGGRPITSVSLDGRAWRRFDGAAETIDLSGAKGSLSLLVRYGR